MTKKDTKNRQNKSREKQTRYLSQAIQLEESVNPHIIRATMTMVSLAILVFIAWSGLTNINEVARTPGEVVPHGHQQNVQHLEGGIVAAIHVRDGDIVEKGQKLLTLGTSGIANDMGRAKVRQTALEMKEERLRAFVENRAPDFYKINDARPSAIADQKRFFEDMRQARLKEERIIRDQIAEKKQALIGLQSELRTQRTNERITNEVYQRRKTLNQKGYASDIQLLDNEKRLNDIQGEIKNLQNRIVSAQTEINEFNGRLESLSARHRDEANERLGQALSEKAENSEIIQKLEERISRLDIRAPARGLIKGLNVNTIGSVVQPGQTVMEIVPLDEKLVVEVKIDPKDVGHIKTGQPVQVKLSSYDFSRYGFIEGYLDHISATTFSGEQGERFYRGRIILDQDHVGANHNNLIIPGMTVMADIITGEKTILQYLLKPVHVSLKTAFTER